MSIQDDEQDQIYVVVINHEEQYALWPDYADAPNGWSVVFGPNPKQACLDYVNEHWTDMRPKSLRDAMAAAGH
ncbi:antibiotic synthesis protein MbtH [Xanthomonas oryzae pv. oryzae]|uniref:MbtH family protein n=1 Tax=Xanthomonas oryzae TaxID=347 RepID=UPI000C7C753D|nr:MbtH family NRPS accessory protein [Xanthomonas oryzae]AUJ12672.1 antibiotic synthesis protein MbtH [Xanthomonas oryzae pv. oryzae]